MKSLDIRFLTEVELAEHLHVTVACVRRWRLERRGPQFRKLGKAVRYSPEAVRLWLSTCPAGGSRNSSAEVQNA